MSAMRIHAILSATEVKRLDREIDLRRRSLNGEIVVPRDPRLKGQPEGLSDRRMGRFAKFMDPNVKEDQALLKKQIAHLERVRSNGSPDSLSAQKKIALDKRVKTMKEWLQTKMCPKDLYFVPYRHENFEKAKKACAVEHTKEFQKVAGEYKNCMRQLDPQDPNASNLERIRPDH